MRVIHYTIYFVGFWIKESSLLRGMLTEVKYQRCLIFSLLFGQKQKRFRSVKNKTRVSAKHHDVSLRRLGIFGHFTKIRVLNQHYDGFLPILAKQNKENGQITQIAHVCGPVGSSDEWGLLPPPLGDLRPRPRRSFANGPRRLADRRPDEM